MSRLPSKYRIGEIKGLVVDYEELVAKKDTTRHGLRIVVALADLSRAMGLLPLGLKRVVLARMVGLSNVAAADQLQISESAVRKRFRQALEHLQVTMNGGYD